jgi:hypothetical protein
MKKIFINSFVIVTYICIASLPFIVHSTLESNNKIGLFDDIKVSNKKQAKKIMNEITYIYENCSKYGYENYILPIGNINNDHTDAETALLSPMFYTCGGGHCLHARRTCNCS